MRILLCLAAASAVGVPALHAGAFHFQTRVVERIGSTDVVLGDSAVYSDHVPHRLRIQFGVFDDANGPAPVGGFYGWYGGINVNRHDILERWTRTPGRLSPYMMSSPDPIGNGLPTQDPFTSLAAIDSGVGVQTVPWVCDGSGEPLPPPQPAIHARNQFASVYEVTFLLPQFPIFGTTVFQWHGHLIGVDRWTLNLQESTPPDCDLHIPGAAVWEPVLTPETQADFVQTFRIIVPAPAAGALGFLGVAFARGRRR